MARPFSYNQEEYDRILVLRAQGSSIREIAATMGLSKSSVHRALEQDDKRP